MKRRGFLFGSPVLIGFPWRLEGQSPTSPPPIPEPHFPGRQYQFVWRNWELANTAQMAKVLRTSGRNVLDLGNGMGLPRKPELTPDQLRLIYITVIRHNWHILPESQIVELLGWTREKLDFTLKEDDFLSIKLGAKPRCAELFYAPPTRGEQKRAAEIRRLLREVLGSALEERGEERFQFVKELSAPPHASLRKLSAASARQEIDLSEGWSVLLPSDEPSAQAARRFHSDLRTAMGARVELAGAASGKKIILESAGGGEGVPGSFQVQAGDEEVRISGPDLDGILQGLYWLRDEMERRGGPYLKKGTTTRKCVWNPRYLYSYFSLYGDPLLETDVDPFPDAYLERLARAGINGVWIQAVLNTLAPSKAFPEFGANSETRLLNLDKLVRRARQFGMKVYLYLNEPRAMPEAFFVKRPEIRGSSYRRLGVYAMCTSVASVREWIGGAIGHIFQQVPGLGGIFSITMSENHTNCYSHGTAQDCPRCSRRQSWEVIGELLRTFRDAVRKYTPAADVIVWDWGWPSELCANLIPRLPRDVEFLSVSEWHQPIHRGGVNTRVGEYSISVVGPGPRAKENWQRAAASGLRTMAKVQFNNTWEISAVPYIPVPQLILEHCENLSKAGISGIMPAWTCGGYPSPNLAAAKAYYFEPRASNEEILEAVALQRYGKAAVTDMVEAWRRFSAAFLEFPYGVAIYTVPTQHGPANPLRLHATGYRAAMILFPYDDLKAWQGSYPPEIAFQQFTKMASLWKQGLAFVGAGVAKASQAGKAAAQLDLAIAETCYNHFQSTANQVEFYVLRAKLEKAGEAERKAALSRMLAIAEHEIELARQQFRIANRHSLIGFEASNHYYYTPLDLAEKILNCRQVIDEIKSGGS